MILLEYNRKNQEALKSTNLKLLLNICIIIEYYANLAYVKFIISHYIM